jgi:O-antigen/teichoic acid export membrane protein
MKTLRQSVIHGSVWTLLSVALSQALRLGKSLILSRLLFPDAYGEMAIVWAVLSCLDLLSDVGLAPGIIRSTRGDDTLFLNTAWTMKIIRGAVLCGITAAIAYPLSRFYVMPHLAVLLPIAGFSIFLEGFSSTKTYSYLRKMHYGRISTIGLVDEFAGLVVTIVWAVMSPTVWALLAGAVAVRISHVLCSHFALPGHGNKFQWDPQAFRELVLFGRWVLFSSAIYVLYSQGDRLILGKYLDANLLGIYAIAMVLSEAVSGMINKLNDTVCFPAISRTALSERDRLRHVLYRIRLGTDIFINIPVGILTIIGAVLVSFLFDPRYHEAGWMLQILCCRLLMISMLAPMSSSLFALGLTRYSVAQNAGRAAMVLIGIPISWHLYGIRGVVWTVAMSELPVIAVVWYGMAKRDLLSMRFELRSLLFYSFGIVMGYLLLAAIPSSLALGTFSLFHRHVN